MTAGAKGLSRASKNALREQPGPKTLDRISLSRAIQGLYMCANGAENQVPRRSVLFVDYRSGRRIQNQPPSVMVSVEVKHPVQRAGDGVG